MNTNHLKEILRRKAELENGMVAPGRVTEVIFDADGKPVRRQLDPKVYQPAAQEQLRSLFTVSA